MNWKVWKKWPIWKDIFDNICVETETTTTPAKRVDLRIVKLITDCRLEVRLMYTPLYKVQVKLTL